MSADILKMSGLFSIIEILSITFETHYYQIVNNFKYKNTSGLEITSEESLQIGEFTESEWLKKAPI